MSDNLHNGRAPQRPPILNRCVSTSTSSLTLRPNNPSNMFSGMPAITSICARLPPDKTASASDVIGMPKYTRKVKLGTPALPPKALQDREAEHFVLWARDGGRI